MTVQPNPDQKRLLALDGGGLMGLISLGVLQEMESQLAEAHNDPEFRLRDFFDYIGGTSTGAIIAAGLMKGMRVGELIALYRSSGAMMFRPAKIWHKVISLLSHRYDHTQLNELLKTHLGDKTIFELQDDDPVMRKKHLLVIAHCVETDSCWPISTNPDGKYNNRDHDDCNLHLPLWKLVRASTAAPFYFRPQFIEFGKKTKIERSFIDGGLTGYNNPAMKLFEMATMPEYRCCWPTGADRLMLISVGAGLAERPVAKSWRMGTPLPSLAREATLDLMRRTTITTDLACRAIGQCVHGDPIDAEVGEAQAPRTAPLFSYARYNIDTSLDNLARHELAPSGGRLKMDDVGQIDTFHRIGEIAGRAVDMRAHFGNFLPGPDHDKAS